MRKKLKYKLWEALLSVLLVAAVVLAKFFPYMMEGTK